MATECNSNGIYPSVKGKKRKFAEKLANPEFDGNISALCDEMKIARSTYYRWMEEDADFKAYVNWLIDKYTDSELANAWRILVNKMKAGSLEALRMFFELKDVYKDKISTGNTAVVIVNDIKPD